MVVVKNKMVATKIKMAWVDPPANYKKPQTQTQTQTPISPQTPFEQTHGDCFGWYADCIALNSEVKCVCKESCYKDWKKSGGRLGGLFDLMS